MTLHGVSPSVVRAAIQRGDPLPGTRGFAGEVDGLLVRDVLGRYPLFVDDEAWAFDPTELDNPRSFPAGHVRSREGLERWGSLPEPALAEPSDGVEAVRSALERAFSTIDTDGLAIAFSGGLDSALLAAVFDVPLYVVGFPDSHDIEAARHGADLLDADLTVVEATHADLERAVPEIVAATGRTNAMDVQIALPLYLVAERVAADGFDRLALGQGADELFGGYAKVAKAPEDPRVESDTVRGATREVIETLPDQLERDVLTVRAAGVEPVAPLLHDAVVEAALGLPGELLVEGETRKVALREAAWRWLPEELATREKKAVQYGSLVARELDRLARQAGFKRRMDDHVTQYVESLSC
ncbi:Asparagine synthase (glutamine-hydrolyzing) [Halapricum desulfuricans]|uniref:Asparagine synthase (Glutamine-hydrolyzing) n=1 Tax=Halapricum desulfuricans TaxID=2841257 RepID=A0A897NI62_9EURY|nr:asparagine synthetase B [Halapricum desulfuricans]QSG12104.1 Asparagine synthase (glutamine-hydrolyzing) [Halapricum desulfuricans]